MVSSGFDSDKRERDDVLFSDKRIDTRHSHEISVDFEVSVDGPHTFFTGFTQDISKGGVFLATHQIYPVGTNMKLVFQVENEHLIVEAIVRWIRPKEKIFNNDLLPGMGLQFLNPPEKLVLVFENFILKRDPLLVDVD